jgi:uncharacterized protein involved in exopolysaccharide biosynthesis
VTNADLHEESAEISIQDLVAVFTGAWKGSCVILAASIVGAVIVAFLIQPTYLAQAVVTPTAMQGDTRSTISQLGAQLGAAASLLSNASTNEGLQAKDVRIATLSSRRLTEDFIRGNDLLPVFFPEAWDREAKSWKVVDGAPQAPTMDAAIEFFNEEVRSISEDRRTGIITVSIEWTDPEVAAAWANDLVRRANDYIRGRIIEETRRSMAFLEEELERTSIVERKQIIYRLIESRTSDVMLANARQEYAFTVVDPAVAPALDNYVRPQRPYIATVGAFIGLFLAVAYAVIRRLASGRGKRVS